MNLEALAAMDDCEQATGKTIEQHRFGWNWNSTGLDSGRLPIVHTMNTDVHRVNTETLNHCEEIKNVTS